MADELKTIATETVEVETKVETPVVAAPIVSKDLSTPLEVRSPWYMKVITSVLGIISVVGGAAGAAHILPVDWCLFAVSLSGGLLGLMKGATKQVTPVQPINK